MLICDPCKQAADQTPRHDPGICIDARRSAEDRRLMGTSCGCQHGQNGTMRNEAEQA